ncbi:diguanylate cyclase [Rahnella bonaserana]|uniref:diguanylate cyclase n=1 Tax=Rahnella bonaserana TaxID=2816248 RepID=A0ABS6LZ62_9GAMM|nr:diguanylate cyclase [Rahnella bonaserana]MBU9856898.1 diguanylate cyclase [Rahnella bonaserana]
MPKKLQTTLVNDTHHSGLRFAKRTYLPRIVGLGTGCFCVGSVMIEHSTPVWLWLLLFFKGFIWPHLAYWKAKRSATPFKSEIQNLQVDAIFGGIWIAVMGFNALPSATIFAMMGMNNISAGGKSLFFRCVIAQISVALALLWVAKIPFLPETSPFQLYLCLPMIMIYPIFLGNVTYRTYRKLAEHKQAIMQISVRDGLTGLYNRRHWESLLNTELESFRRYRHKTTLVLIDIDHFKSINDNYGHSVGDQAIILLAQELQQTMRTADIIGRFGGDEFAAILPHSTKLQAKRAIERLQSRLANSLFPHHPELQIHISAGIAECDDAQETPTNWLNAADSALYIAKKSGRNRVEIAE